MGIARKGCVGMANFAFAALLLAGAAPPDAPAGPVCRRVTLETAVARYAAYGQAKNVRRIATFYGPGGVLVGHDGLPVNGAREIETYLAGAGSGELMSDGMTPAVIAAAGAGWRVEGSFARPDAPPGRFAADWACTAAGWRIKRMTIGTETP